MKTVKATATMLVASLLSLPLAANAYEGQCDAKIYDVEAAIVGAEYYGKGPDESNLLTKLTYAEAKLGWDKYDDAIQKLLDISDKATALADAPKQKISGADAINESVEAAIGCVGSLVPSS